MSHDLPTLPDILRVVRDYLDSIRDAVPEQDRYHAICCSHLLSIAEREVTRGAMLDAEEAAALNAFLGKTLHPGAAICEFAKGLRAGAFDAQWETATALVLQSVIDKVLITKPDHLHPMHREESP
jgi:hypothetical protein